MCTPQRSNNLDLKADVNRKLMVVDYLGAALTLTGCTLLLLPLIWVGSDDRCTFLMRVIHGDLE